MAARVGEARDMRGPAESHGLGGQVLLDAVLEIVGPLGERVHQAPVDLLDLLEDGGRVELELLLVLLHLLEAVLEAVPAPLDLVVDARDLALEDVTVRLLAVAAYLFIAVGARVHVRLLRADVAPRHDGVRVRVRQLA